MVSDTRRHRRVGSRRPTAGRRSASFRTYRNKPPYVRERELKMTREMADRLAALDSGQLSAELGAYINRDQIRALLRRRDSLINGWAEIQSP